MFNDNQPTRLGGFIEMKDELLMDAPEEVTMVGRGCGRRVAIAAMIAKECLMRPGTRVLYVGKSKDGVFCETVKRVAEAVKNTRLKNEGLRGVLKIDFANGSRITAVRCRSKEDTRRFTGMAAQMVIVEAGFFDGFEEEKREFVWWQVCSRARKIDGVEYGVFYDDGTPLHEGRGTLNEAIANCCRRRQEAKCE